MKEIEDIVAAYERLDTDNQRVALATVVRVAGSSYRRTGARMLVQENGVWVGGISGGCLEGDALKKAKYSMTRGRANVVTYDTTQDDEHQIGVGLGCNGVIDVLLSPIYPGDAQNPITILKSCLDERTVNILLTVIRGSEQDDQLKAGDMVKYVEKGTLDQHFSKDLIPDLQTDIATALRTQRSMVCAYGQWEIFIEVLLPPIHLVLFGSNYDVYPLLKLSRELGWRTDVVTNPLKASRAMFQLAQRIIPKDQQPKIDDRTAFILMAHDYKTDQENLRQSLQSEVPYIGLLGPAKRARKAIQELEAAGLTISEQDQQRLYYPIGLDIGANTPETIAMAILAEVQAHFLERPAGFLKHRTGTIHERTGVEARAN